jgi:hypothetical protein
MKAGIGLPNAVRGVGRAGIVEWAQRAERAGFASLGTLDRLVYANYESLIALAAAVAVTERIELASASGRVSGAVPGMAEHCRRSRGWRPKGPRLSECSNLCL